MKSALGTVRRMSPILCHCFILSLPKVSRVSTLLDKFNLASPPLIVLVWRSSCCVRSSPFPAFFLQYGTDSDIVWLRQFLRLQIPVGKIGNLSDSDLLSL